MTYSNASLARSIFYVYYEQYLTMWADTGASLGVSVGVVFLVTLVITMDIVSMAFGGQTKVYAWLSITQRTCFK